MLLTREQLQERLIGLHRASLELVKEVSSERLLERIAATACEQAGARYAALGVRDSQGALKQFIPVGLSDAQIKRIPHPPVGLGLIGALMHAEAPIRLPVIANDPRAVGFPKNHPHMVSFLGVPIRAGELQLGEIYLTDKLNYTEFTADDERIIQMLAGYAAAAIQNTRLLEQIQTRDVVLTRRTEDLALLNNIASALTASLELGQVLDKTLAVVMNYLNAEAGEIFLLEDDKATLRMSLHQGQAAEAFWTRSQFRLGEGVIGQVAQTGRAHLTAELGSDLQYLGPALVKAGFHQIAYWPLKSGESLMGVMSVATRSAQPLDERELELVGAVANWAGLAIENGQLHQNAQRLAVLEERDRIGMDLHDGIIQSVFAVGLTLENASHSVDEDPAVAKLRIKEAIGGLNQAIRDIRAYILDLRPRQMGAEGLVSGLRRLALEYRANTFSEVALQVPAEGADHLPHASALALFHICQEALANAAKHARAKQLDLNLWMSADRVVLEIHDDGQGFAVEKMSTTIGHGLSNMQTRAHSVGGDVDISSGTGEGTTVLAWVPRN